MSESAEESQRSKAQHGGPEGHDHLEQVDRHVASTVKKMVRDLHDLASAAEDEAVGQLLAATARVDGETTQSGILTALLEESRRFASRTAFFLTRPGEVRGWDGRGFPAVERARLDYEEGSVWARMAAQAGAMKLSAEECKSVSRSLGAPAGGPGVLIPFTLRGQLGGVLYADRPESEGPLGISSLQLLTHSAAQTIETAALRQDGGSPALRFCSEMPPAASPMSLWQPPESAEPAEAAPAEAAPAGVAGAVAAAGVAAAAVAGAATAADEVAEEEAPAVPEVKEETAPPAPEEEEMLEAAAEAAPAEEEMEAPVEEAAEAIYESVPVAVEEDAEAEAVDFEMVTEVEEERQAVEDIEAELEPEPELEDTSDLWAVEEEEEVEEEEDETFVGSAPVTGPGTMGAEPAVDLTAAESTVDRPAVMPPEVGQETVRLDIAALQGQMPAAPASPAPEQETAGLPQWEVEAAPEPAAQDFELEPEVEPAYEIEPSEPITTPMAKPDFSEDATIISRPRVEPSPAAGGYVPPTASTEVMPPPDMMPSTPSTEVMPPPDMMPSTPSTEVTPPPDMMPSAPSTEVTPPPDMMPSAPSTEVTPPPDMMPSAPSTEVTPPPDMMPSAPSTEVTPPARGVPPTEVAPPPSSGFAAPPAKKADTGTSQVVPPTDIQGPGSAFGGDSTGGIPEGEEALHEEARRLARLLVSEIKLYNEEIIEEGRRSGNIYDRLKDDIDRSRQMYEERIDPRLLQSDNDYFRRELVQRLAGGDERLLGY